MKSKLVARLAGALILGGSLSAAGFVTPALAQRQATDAARGETAQGLRAANDRPTNFRRDRNVAVRDRPRPDYNGLGINLGAFTGQAHLLVTGEYNDNIFATTTTTDDIILHYQPELTIRSGWSRHELAGYARAQINRNIDFSSEDSEEYALGLSGRLDILSTGSVKLTTDYQHQSEARSSSNTPTNSVNPIEFDTAGAALAGTYEFNRLKISGLVDFRQFDYDDGRTSLGAVIEQDDRDRDITTFTARADYAISPATALFLQGSVNERSYRLKPPAVALNRDSTGYEILAGANFELSSLVRGDIGVGYIHQDYDDPAQNDLDGFGARGRLEWFPTRLTTVTLVGARSVEDSGILGSSGYLSTNVSLQVDHELMRNLILTGYAGVGSDDFEGILRSDDRVNLAVSATWLLNRRAALTASFNHFDQNSSGLAAGTNFEINRVSIGFNLQY